jgi:hypothetical protein
MARMLPPVISPDTQSPAERQIFRRIEEETPHEWVAIHSLGLKGHRRKAWAEADFVLVTDLGVWVLEIKGGAITRRDRVWLQNGNPMRESPFDQAGGGAGALRRDLRDHVEVARRIPIAHGVVFPDVEFEVDGPDLEQRIVYDARDERNDFSAYVDRLWQYWSERLGSPGYRLSRGDRGRIVRRLAGDFDLVPSLRGRIRRIDEDLVRLTEQQKLALAGMATNSRVVLEGGAGTGKTLLALEEARRIGRDSGTTLFTCHSRRLAQMLQQALADIPQLDVWHYQGLLAHLIDEAGLRGEVPDVQDRDRFDVIFPELAARGFERLARPRYKALIVDEAQDLLLTDHLAFFDSVLDGGLSSGYWRFFLDPFQNFFGAAGDDARDLLRDDGFVFRLNINCRNTAPIAFQAAMLSGRSISETLSPEGPAIEQHWYVSAASQRKSIVRQVHEWLKAGVRPDEMTILSPVRRERSALADLTGMPARVWEAGEGSRPDDSIEFATVASFKGLESTVVLAIDIDSLNDEWMRSIVYVAASRATTLLAMWLDENLRERYEDLARMLGQRLSQQQ